MLSGVGCQNRVLGVESIRGHDPDRVDLRIRHQLLGRLVHLHLGVDGMRGLADVRVDVGASIDLGVRTEIDPAQDAHGACAQADHSGPHDSFSQPFAPQ